MATLTREQFDQLTDLLADPTSERGALFADDPALRAEAERLTAEFNKERSDAVIQQIPQNISAAQRAPGLALANMSAGTQKTLYSAGVFAADLASALVPTDSAAYKAAREARESIANARTAAEAEQERFVDEQLGGQIEGELGAVVETGGGLVGEGLPAFVAPAGLSTYWRTVGYNGMLGLGVAGVADTQAKDMRDRLSNMTIGGLSGVILAGALHAPGGLKAYSARKINRTLETDLAKQNIALEEEIRRITGDPNFSFSLGQVTANPFITGLEIGAARAVQRTAQNERIQTLADSIKLRANALSSRGDEATIAADLQQTIASLNKQLQTRASKNFSAGMDNIVTNFGDDVIIDGKHYLSEAKRLAAEFSDPTLGGSGAPKFLTEQIKRLESTLKTKGGLDSEATGKLLQSFRRISSGEVPTFEQAAPGSGKNLANALRKAMMESLDDTNVVNKDAVEAIRSLRKVYQTDQAQITGYNRALIKDLFGGETAAANPEAAFQTLVRRGVPSQRATVKVLEDTNNVALLEDIRGQYMRSIVEASQVPGTQTSINRINPRKLAANLAGRTGTTGAAGKGLFGAKDSLHLKRTGEAIETLMETHLSLFPEASQGVLGDVAINVVSRAPEFFSRFLVRVFSSGRAMERVLNDPAFRESVIQVANKGLGSKAAQAAVIYMAVTLSTWEADDERERRQREQANPAPSIERTF